MAEETHPLPDFHFSVEWGDTTGIERPQWFITRLLEYLKSLSLKIKTT